MMMITRRIQTRRRRCSRRHRRRRCRFYRRRCGQVISTELGLPRRRTTVYAADAAADAFADASADATANDSADAADAADAAATVSVHPTRASIQLVRLSKKKKTG